MRRRAFLALGLSSLCLPALGQIFPNNAKEPVEVVKPRGAFAQKLHGTVMPAGKGWKPAMDAERMLQIMLPAKWKVQPDPEAALRAVPPGHEKDPRAVLTVFFKIPSDADPLEVDEKFALGYVDAVVEEEPALKQLQFKATDAGYVVARGQKFALAGGTLQIGPTKQQQMYQMQQLVYISEDRIVSVQFMAPQAEFGRYADDVAKIFSSYQDIGMRKVGDE